mgnify:CR=1 FL=1
MNIWIRFKYWFIINFSAKTLFDVELYLKSGSVIKLTNISDLNTKRNSDGFTEFGWTSESPVHKLVSINPGDISAVVQRIK